MQLFFRKTGRAAAVFQVRSGHGQTGPWTYTVGAGDETSDHLATDSSYDWAVYGPNGFLRTFVGSLGADSAKLTVKTSYGRNSGGVALVIQKPGLKHRESGRL